MNMFWHELRSYRKSTIIWILSLSCLIIFYLSLYPAFASDIATTKKLFLGIPQAYRAILDIHLDTFFTVLGFYSYLMTFVVLAGAVQAMNIGVGIVSKETRLKTAEFLLTKPVTRTKIMTSKICAAFSLIVITNLVYSSVAVASASVLVTEHFSLKIFLMISAILFFVQLFFLALGFLYSVSFPKIKSVVSYSLPTVFTFFIINMLDSVIGNKNIRYVTPFKFFNTVYIIKHSAYEARFIIFEIILIIFAFIASYIIYVKKDISSI